MENKKKRIIIATAGGILLVVALAILLFHRLFAGRAGFLLDKLSDEDPDELSYTKYVTESGLDYGESYWPILGKYSAYRERLGFSVDHLEIKCDQSRMEEKDYVTYLVFDSAADAKKYYWNKYDFLIEYAKDHGQSEDARILSKGIFWFEAKMPVNDAVNTKLFFLVDNVVFDIDVYFESYNTEPHEEKPYKKPDFTGDEIAKYVKNNAKDLRRFVLTEIYPEIIQE